MMIAVQALYYLLAPGIALWITRRSKFADALGPVAFCYALGILFGNLVSLEQAVSMNLAGGAVIVAIPMLLFTVDVPAWLRSAPSTIIASLIAFFSVGVVATGVGVWAYHGMPNVPEMAAAFAAVYTGGTPNMMAIAKALQFSPELLVTLNVSDTLIAGPFYFVLSSIGPRFFALFLKTPPRTAEDAFELEQDHKRAPMPAILKGLATGIMTAGIALGIAQLLPPESRDLSAVILASTLGIVFSFSRNIRETPGTFQTGEYLLLLFCTGIGSMTNLGVLQELQPNIVIFNAMIFFGSQILQYSLFGLFRIDRDTAMMASIASIYSPAFVAPVAARLNSKKAMFTGVTIGLVGYAIAVYLGLFVHWLIPTLAR